MKPESVHCLESLAGWVTKLSSTLKDSLEYRLKRDGYVDVKLKLTYSMLITAG